eukprot:1634739-Amphidinium_carterae.1
MHTDDPLDPRLHDAGYQVPPPQGDVPTEAEALGYDQGGEEPLAKRMRPSEPDWSQYFVNTVDYVLSRNGSSLVALVGAARQKEVQWQKLTDPQKL